MVSRLYEKGVVTRSLSTNYTQESFEKDLDVGRQLALHAKSVLDAAAPDRRVIATSNDMWMFSHEAWLVEGDNAWTEYLYLNISCVALVEALRKPSRVGDPPAKLLMTPVWSLRPFLVDGDPGMEYGGNCVRYYLNTWRQGVIEEARDSIEGIVPRHEIPYHVVDHQEFLNGSLDNSFDVARIGAEDVLTPNMELLHKMMDSVRPGGIFILFGSADFGALYRNCAGLHEKRGYPVHREMMSRTDYEIYHLPMDEFGVSVGYRKL